MPDIKTLTQNIWPEIITRLGVDGSLLDGKHHAFPEIGCNTDGFRYIDKQGDGYCSLGAGEFGTGFGLLMKLNGWDFAKTASEIEAVMGWSDKSYIPPTRDELAARQTKQVQEALEREQALAGQHRIAAEQSLALWDSSTPATCNHPYLKAKGVQPYGIRMDGECLIIPIRIGNEMTSYQRIYPKRLTDKDGKDTGNKRFATGGDMSGGYYHISGDDRGSAERAILCEGFATGASIRQTTGQHVVVAFTATNLVKVANIIRANSPSCKIIIAADNDQKYDINTGLIAATKAAQAVGGVIALPTGKEGLNVDWNDIHQDHGLDVVAAGIANTFKPDVVADADVWDEPEPFDVMEYPTLPSKGDMPPQLWQIVNYAAQQAGSNTSFSFASSLSTLAAVYRGKVYVARKDGSIRNLVTVFAINAALSGEGKSATRSFVDKPLQEIAANLKKQCGEAMARWRTEANAAKKSIKALEKDLSDELRDMTSMEEVSNLNQMNLINSPPKVGLAIYSQSTPEAFIEKCDSDGFVMLSTDEGSAVVESFGRYSNQSGADMSPVLKAFDGSIDNVARRGDNSYGGVLKGCLDLSVQSSVLNRIVGDEEMRTRGFINRFIIMVTPTTAGTLNYHHRPTKDEALEKRWRSLVMRMNEMVEALGDSETTVLLDNEADRLHSDYANSLQLRVSEDGDLESMKDLFSRRHPAYVMRLAALYHPLMGGTLDSRIRPETMRYAIASGKLIASHYIAAVGSASSPETNRAKKTIEKLIKAGIQQVSVRDLSRRHWTGTASSEDALSVLQTLNDKGWVREIQQRHAGGRPPSPLFELHPESSVFISQTQVTKVPQVTKGVETEAFGTLGTSGTSPKEIKKVIQPNPKVGELGDDGKIIHANQPPANEDFQHETLAPEQGRVRGVV